MINIPHYQQETFLTGPLSNNAFDYEVRSESNPEPNLRIAPLQNHPNHRKALASLTISTSPAFEIIEENKLKSFAGLQTFLQFPNPSNPTSPIFIFDNHNHAYYFWHLSRLTLKLPTPLELIHIDQHKDSRIPTEIQSPENANSPDELYRYANDILNVGNFIPPTIKTGLVNRVTNIDSSISVTEGIAKYAKPSSHPTPYILDLDLDFFAPELDYIPKADKLTLIKTLLPEASITTIASSPFFLNQDLAISLLREIFAD